MPRHPGDDPYLDPATGVLKNRLGIADATTLEQAEAAIVATRSYELSLAPLKGRFDLVHLQDIHRYLFRDLYEWAGELRRIDISKGGHRFAHHAHIVDAATPIFAQLSEEKYLAGLAPTPFSRCAAHYLSEINALHPFREGNGRTQREFVSHLAYAAGYYLAWENVTQAEMLEASVESFKGNTARLTQLVNGIVRRLDE